MRYPSLAIANEFIDRSLASASGITHMHVQKFVYLANGFCLATKDEPLVEERFEAWSFGPVIRRLYDALKAYGKSPIPRQIFWGDDFPFGRESDSVPARVRLSNLEATIVEGVWSNYGAMTAYQLSALTHETDTPWYKFFQPSMNTVIPDYAIADYFKGL